MRLFGIPLAICMLIGGAAAQKCGSISAVDFWNSRIQIPSDGEVHFQDGKADGSLFKGLEGTPAAVEWHWSIRSEAFASPGPGVEFGFVEIVRDHVNGTGSLTSVLGFRCIDGAVKQVFAVQREDMQLVSASRNELLLKFAVWKNSDSHARPSERITVPFAWNPDKQTYVPTAPIPPDFEH